MYVDGFLIAVPKSKRAAYTKMARLGKKVWLEHGALEYRECVADDVSWGKSTSFPRAVKQKKNETVWFSYIVYRNRKHRDQVNKKVMQDKRLLECCNGKDMPFEVKRMAYGGFEAFVEA